MKNTSVYIYELALVQILYTWVFAYKRTLLLVLYKNEIIIVY